VVIGGGVSKAGDYLVETVKKHYEALAVLSERKADIALAKLGNDAGIYGAAKLAMDSAR
jgi:glucokinase